ncbi:MAG: hypothetical protein IKY94_00335 [Lachnospiraceae bacterium]|nr:hypothetical protein [Lachnospiraceae bacterium]
MEKNNTNLMSDANSSDIKQHEDAVLKTAMQFFADELLPYLGIKEKVVSFAPTELVHLELQKLFQDFNFIMDDGTWKHFEFQSTNEGLEALKRFRAYEALTSYLHKVSVETYVLFSGNIKHPMTQFTEGYNTYKIKPIIMQQRNADKLLFDLEQKQKEGKSITKKDLIPLILCPLMSGNSSQKDRINKAYHIIRNTTEIEKTDASKIEAMLYAMADKFLDKMDLEKLKEDMTMTRLGQMIWEDGIAEGELRGIEKTLIQKVKIKLEKGKTVEEIADDLEESTEKIVELINTL